MLMKSCLSAAVAMMLVCLASTVQAEGREACLDACYSAQEIIDKCPPNFRPVVRQKNCYRCCRYT